MCDWKCFCVLGVVLLDFKEVQIPANRIFKEKKNIYIHKALFMSGFDQSGAHFFIIQRKKINFFTWKSRYHRAVCDYGGVIWEKKKRIFLEGEEKNILIGAGLCCTLKTSFWGSGEGLK